MREEEGGMGGRGAERTRRGGEERGTKPSGRAVISTACRKLCRLRNTLCFTKRRKPVHAIMQQLPVGGSVRKSGPGRLFRLLTSIPGGERAGRLQLIL